MTTEDQDLFGALKYHVVVSAITGVRKYYNNAGVLHREEGPAIIWPNGTKLWYQNGSLHRTDGPAVEWSDGGREWWLNGVRYSEHAYLLCVANHSSSITEP